MKFESLPTIFLHIFNDVAVRVSRSLCQENIEMGSQPGRNSITREPVKEEIFEDRQLQFTLIKTFYRLRGSRPRRAAHARKRAETRSATSSKYSMAVFERRRTVWPRKTDNKSIRNQTIK